MRWRRGGGRGGTGGGKDGEEGEEEKEGWWIKEGCVDEKMTGWHL